jgi:hypothetical protein
MTSTFGNKDVIYNITLNYLRVDIPGPLPVGTTDARPDKTHIDLNYGGHHSLSTAIPLRTMKY